MRSSEVVLTESVGDENVDLEKEFSPRDRELVDLLWSRKLARLDECPKLEPQQRSAAVWELSATCDIQELINPKFEFKWSVKQQEYFLSELVRLKQLVETNNYAIDLPLMVFLRGLQTYRLFNPNDKLVFTPPQRGVIDRLLRTPVTSGPEWKLRTDEVPKIMSSLEACVRNPESNVLDLSSAGEAILFLKIYQPHLRQRLLALSGVMCDRQAAEEDPNHGIQYTLSAHLAFPELQGRFPLTQTAVPDLRGWLRESLNTLPNDRFGITSALDLAFRLQVLCMAGAQEMGVNEQDRIYFVPRPVIRSSRPPLPTRPTT